MSAQKARNMHLKVRELQSKLSCAAKQSLDRRFGALYDKIYREDVLRVAWSRVRANNGVPGVDEQDFKFIEEQIGVEQFLKELREDLRLQKYVPQPVLRCWIDKPGKSEKRPLGIPVIRDRTAEMAAKLILEPIFETNFLESSHGFRPGRDQLTAIAAIDKAVTFDRMRTAIDADIVGFFGNIRKDLLLKLLGRRISDPRVLKLIRAWLDAGVMEEGVYQAAGETGTPQGSPISPLLSNIYLHSFDKMFAQSGIRGVLVRYADDFVVLLNGDGRRELELIRNMLKRLGLQLHPEKTRIVSVRKGFDFVGMHARVRPVRKRGSRLKESCRFWPSKKAVARIKDKVRETIGRQFGKTLEEIIQLLNPVIRGWNNYQTRNRWARTASKCFTGLNWFVRDRLRIFLKRKYDLQSRGTRKLADNLLVRLGLAQFGW
jgi:RNA-directed DNA polymerase